MAGNSIFIVSDRTGITIEGLVRTLLTQFEDAPAERTVRPFCDDAVKVDRVVAEIDAAAEADGAPPLVYSSIVDTGLRERIKLSQGRVLDIFDAFIPAMSESLHMPSRARVVLI